MGGGFRGGFGHRGFGRGFYGYGYPGFYGGFYPYSYGYPWGYDYGYPYGCDPYTGYGCYPPAGGYSYSGYPSAGAYGYYGDPPADPPDDPPADRPADPPSMHSYRAPRSSAAPAAPKPMQFSIVLKNGVTHSAVSYWVMSGILTYVDANGEEHHVPLSMVDRARSARLNESRGVDFALPSETSS
jgi:hypothetical protein